MSPDGTVDGGDATVTGAPRRWGLGPAEEPSDHASASFVARLENAVPDGVTDRLFDRLALSHDASHFILTPQAVVRPRSKDQVARLIRTTPAPLTFRSGATSLSGQAGTGDVLVDTRRHFRDIEVLDEGVRVRVGPGATVQAVNRRLARHGRRIGPDPASEAACTIGGVIANNSSGMLCGTEENAYQTLESAVLVLPSGTVVDTAADDAERRLWSVEPALMSGLVRLRDRVRGNPASVAAIVRLYSLKNTMGYGINAFIDHDAPLDILLRLIVGSEGTLAFVAEATFRTVPVKPHAATGLLVFPDLASATAAVPVLTGQRFAAIELMDSLSLTVAQRSGDLPGVLGSLNIAGHAALLVEHQDESLSALGEKAAESEASALELHLSSPALWSTDAVTRARLWRVRKGLYPAVAGTRPPGTTALLEDIAVPGAALLATCLGLGDLFRAYRYDRAVVFGHAKDGNLHFLIQERFDQPEGVDRYRAFTGDMVDLVLGHGGTLKAEHGTGRIMAPFLRRQYGDELFDVMCSVKRLLDPRGVLNPGVVITDDAQAHLSHLKATPPVHEDIDRCTDCGYCEPVCPSRDLTTTPRQRIAIQREIALARASGERAVQLQLEADFEYDGTQTCAVDGMCQTACPVGINTGDLTTRLRRSGHGRVTQWVGERAAKRWDAVTSAASAGMTTARRLPVVSERATRLARASFGHEILPLWTSDLGAGGPRRETSDGETAPPQAVHFASCTGTIFGSAAESGVSEALRRVCGEAGVALVAPEGIASLCCGTPWKSKGLHRGYSTMQGLVVERLLRATRGGALVVVVDATSCTDGLSELVSHRPELRVVDAVEFVADHVLPRLEMERLLDSLTLHPTCASYRLGLDDHVLKVAHFLANEVIVPDNWACCGFAGDRGLLHPELTASATQAEAAEIVTLETAAFASVNRPCEVAMTRATSHPYLHILQFLDVLARRRR